MAKAGVDSSVATLVAFLRPCFWLLRFMLWAPLIALLVNAFYSLKGWFSKEKDSEEQEMSALVNNRV